MNIVKDCQRRFNFDMIFWLCIVSDFKLDIGCTTTCFANICENFCPCILLGAACRGASETRGAKDTGNIRGEEWEGCFPPPPSTGV